MRKMQKQLHIASQRLLSQLLSDAARPLRFICIGGMSGLLQLTLLNLLCWLGWNTLLANVVGFFLAVQINFLFSQLFTWHDSRPELAGKRIVLARWLSFHASIAGTACVNMLVFAITHLFVSATLASILGICSAALLNFLVFNHLVFRIRPGVQKTEPFADVHSSANYISSQQTFCCEEKIWGLSEIPLAVYNQNGKRTIMHIMPLLQEKKTRIAASDQPVYSIVAPVFNEAETLPHFYERIIQVMEGTGEPFELLLVNDGSSDNTYAIMSDLHQKDSRVRALDFSRNFGHQVAISAGLDHARGDAVIIIDSDLQDPPEVIPQLIERWKQGAEVVYAQRSRRAGETFFKLVTASAFYRLIDRLTSIRIPRDTGDFRLLDRRVVRTLVTMREQHRFMRGLSSWVGFRQEAVQYERHERFAGSTKYPLRKMIRFSLDAITSFSHLPLQLATSFGFFLAGLSLLGILVAIGLRLFTGAIVGQATTLILVLLIGGIQLIFLGIIGEYLGRIYDEVRSRPLYVLRETLDQNTNKLPTAI